VEEESREWECNEVQRRTRSTTESTRMRIESVVGRRWPREVSSLIRIRSGPVKT
jgi:hypothetical protein